MNVLKNTYRLSVIKIWLATFMLSVASASVSYGQYEIGKEFIEQKAREFHSIKGAHSSSKKYYTGNPKEGIVLSSLRLQDGYWPEIEVTFSKTRVSIGGPHYC